MADIKCEVCDKTLMDSDDNTHFTDIRRGYFREEQDGHLIMEREKARFFICNDCYFNDPDLCKFFNKIGWKVR